MKKKRFFWIGLIVLVVAIAASRMIPEKGVTVEMGTVQKGNIDKYVEEIATVFVEDEVSVYAVEGGLVVKVLADTGYTVRKGDALIQIDDKEIIMEKQILVAQMKSASAQYEEKKKPVDSEEINKLRAQVRSAEIKYEEAKRSMENHKSLYDAGAISHNDYQKFVVNFDTSEAELEVTKSNLALAQKGISINIEKQYQAQITEIEKRIEILEKKHRDLVIQSPIDGIVMANKIKTGNILQSGALVMEIGSTTGYYLESDILMEEIASVQQGSIVMINNEDLGIKDAEGTIINISPKAFGKVSDLGIEQKRVKVKIRMDEEIKTIKPGYDLEIKIITDSRKNILLVDEKAVFTYQGKDCVFIVEDGIAKLRNIEKGLESDQKIEVLSGLREGEKVILSPNEEIKEGSRIK